MDIVWLGAGLGLLVLGAEGLVRGGVGLARTFKVSPLLIGVTIVAYGTSTPELVVSIDASLKGFHGLAVGNVVGSNIFNILLILGLTALIMPIKVSPQAIMRDGGFALLAAVLFIAIGLSSATVQPWHGAVMLVLLLLLTVYTYRQERSGKTPAGDLHAAEAAEIETPSQSPLINIMLVIGGVGLLILGSRWLVDSGVSIAREFGVSETIIGLTLISAGTSLPELATSVIAALRRHPDVALGNVVGSNIYNILAILGVASTITPLSIDPGIVRVDMWVMLAATLMVVPALFIGHRIGRIYGACFLAAYAGYIGWLFSNNIG